MQLIIRDLIYRSPHKYFTPIAGQSMEAKSYKEALTKLTEQIKK